MNLPGLLIYLVNIIIFAILGRIIISWLLVAGVRSDFVVRFDYALSFLTEPVMRPLRRIVPTIGMFDLTPMVAIIVLSLLQSVIRRLL